MLLKRIPKPLLFFLLLVVIAATYFDQMYFLLPTGIHAWAQADRLSLAIKFYDNGMNFLRPATFNLMSENGITGVEFPIQSYLAAVCGKIFGREYISMSFRILNTLISCIGLTFLFAAGYKRTGNFLFSSVAPLFLFCSPVFIYYTCNYLPDTASASLLLVAFYYVLNYLDDSKNKSLFTVFAWLTIAALIKTSAALYIMGFAGYIVLHQLFIAKQYTIKTYLPVVFGAFISLIVLYAYYSYSRHVNKMHGDPGVFMAQLKPFKDWDKFNYYINNSLKDRWLKEYFVLPEYLLFLVIFIPAFAFLRKDITGKKQLNLLMIFLSGSLGVGYLMGTQLIGHDYYMIVILFPTIIFAVLVAVIALFKNVATTPALKPVKYGILASLILIYCLADYQIHQRLYPDYYPFNPGVPWMAGGSKILDSLGISKQERIVVFDDDPCNLGLYYFDRMGYDITQNQWDRRFSYVDSFMKSKHTHIMAMSASKINMVKGNDSTTFSHFTPLSIKDSIAVYRLEY